MPKFDIGLNGVDVDAAEVRQEWKGPLPPKGSYPAKLRLVQVKDIKGKAEKRLSIMVTLNTENIDVLEQFHDCPVWGNLNLTDQGVPFINQFLDALTDGSEAQSKKIRKSFYAGFITDEKKNNVLRIGTWKVNSPEGELPIMISLGHSTWEGKTSAKIASFLLPGSDEANSVGDAEEEVVEEDDDVAEESDDESDVESQDDEESFFDEDLENEEEDEEENASV